MRPCSSQPRGIPPSGRRSSNGASTIDLDKKGENPELATEALQWLRAHSDGPDDLPVIFLNHPGRRAKDVEAVWHEWSFLAKEGAGIVVGAEGAPGHQNAKPLGAYGGAIVPEDRWDPSVVAPGAAWDRLLQQGQDAWGALASSDFHAESNGDYWPCQFSYTAIYAPDRSEAGVLRALRAGSFVGVHGGIVRSAELRVMSPGLERPALAGESIRVAAGAALSVDLVMDIPGTDWSGAANHIDAIDLIGISKDGARIVASGTPGADGRWHSEVTTPAGGIVLRARGRRVIDDGPDLLFYTNPVRVTAAELSTWLTRVTQNGTRTLVGDSPPFTQMVTLTQGAAWGDGSQSPHACLGSPRIEEGHVRDQHGRHESPDLHRRPHAKVKRQADEQHRRP